MFDLGWTELMVIGVVALIVVGPKDLPGMFRTAGQFMGKAKRMAREFSQAMNDAADDTGVGDVKNILNSATNPVKTAMDQVRSSTDSFTKQTMESGKPKLDPERQEKADKIRAKTADFVNERKAAEAEAEVTAKATPTKKAPAKKAPVKKAAAKKTVAKKPAAKTTAATRSGASKAAISTKKPAAAKKPTRRKPAAKKTAVKPSEDKA